MIITEEDCSLKLADFIKKYKDVIQSQTKFKDDDKNFKILFAQTSKLFTSNKGIFTKALNDYQDRYVLSQIFGSPKDVKFYKEDGQTDLEESSEDDDSDDDNSRSSSPGATKPTHSIKREQVNLISEDEDEDDNETDYDEH